MTTLNLLVRKEDGKTEGYTLQPGESLTLGRAPECGLVLDYEKISRTHCRIEERNGSWVVMDLQSLNGLFVNEQRLDKGGERVLNNRDIIRLGRCHLDVTLPEAVNQDATVMDVSDATVLETSDATLQDVLESVDRTLTQPSKEPSSPRKDPFPSPTPAAGREMGMTELSSLLDQSTAGARTKPKDVGSDHTVVRSSSEPLPLPNLNSVFNYLEVVSGPFVGKRHPLSDPCVVGRDAQSCQIVLSDRTISRQHVQLKRNDKGVWVFSCLAAENPVMHNGKESRQGELRHGDRMQVGDWELKVHLQEDKGGGGNPKKTMLVAGALFSLVLLAAAVGYRVFFSHPPVKEESPAAASSQGPSSQQASGQGGDGKPGGDNAQLDNVLKGIILEKKRGEYEKALAATLKALEEYKDNPSLLKLQGEIQEKAKAAKTDRENKAKWVDEVNAALADVGKALSDKKIHEANQKFNAIEQQKLQDVNDSALWASYNKIKEELGRARTEQADLAAQQETRNKQIRAKLSEINTDVRENNIVDAAIKMNGISSLVPGASADVNKEYKAIKEKIDKELSGVVARDLALGNRSMKEGKMAFALESFAKVVSIHPDHPDAKPLYDKLLLQQAAEAKKYYDEGRMVESLGNVDKAKENWNRALRELPIPSHPLYIKTRAMLDKYLR